MLLSLKNPHIDKRSAEYHRQYFLKTGEAKTDFLTLESEEKEMIMKIDKSKAIHDAVFATAIEEAKEQGIEQGREEERRTLAVKLLKTGLSIEQVSEVTGLSIDFLIKLKSE